MQTQTDYIVNAILLVGACLLGVSFYPIQRLMAQLPKSAIRTKWNEVRALVLFFIAGYLIFTYLYWLKQDEKFDLIVPAVFFLGAVLVLFIGMLALETAGEIERITFLQKENITDHLIGIFNRRFFDRKVAEEFTRGGRYGTPLSILLLDIDHFKNVNDKYGHQVGDRTLQSLGKLLLNEARSTDIIARYGGEEIAILATQTSATEAEALAERLRKSVEASIMVTADKKRKRSAISITVSIGVAGFDRLDPSHHVFIERADRALYRAKQTGRNRVVVYDDKM